MEGINTRIQRKSRRKGTGARSPAGRREISHGARDDGALRAQINRQGQVRARRFVPFFTSRCRASDGFINVWDCTQVRVRSPIRHPHLRHRLFSREGWDRAPGNSLILLVHPSCTGRRQRFRRILAFPISSLRPFPTSRCVLTPRDPDEAGRSTDM